MREVRKRKGDLFTVWFIKKNALQNSPFCEKLCPAVSVFVDTVLAQLCASWEVYLSLYRYNQILFSTFSFFLNN